MFPSITLFILICFTACLGVARGDSAKPPLRTRRLLPPIPVLHNQSQSLHQSTLPTYSTVFSNPLFSQSEDEHFGMEYTNPPAVTQDQPDEKDYPPPLWGAPPTHRHGSIATKPEHHPER